MKAILATASGAQAADIPTPQPGPDDILVRVHAAGLNRADLGALAAAQGNVLGMEFAGEVVEVGSAVTEHKRGDRVMCTGPGAYAEYALADRGRALPVPAGMALPDAAVLMLACQTMHNAIATAGRLQRGESLMIHGASSGVGLAALQIGRLLGAGTVIGTSTNAGRRARLKDFGADHAIDPTTAAWADQAIAATGGKGVDVIVDQVSGPGLRETMRACAVLARVVNVGRLGGKEGLFDFEWHALRRISYVGVTFRTRSLQEVRDIVAAMGRDLLPAIAAGRLRLPIDRVFPLEQAAAALEHMRANKHFGKIALAM